MKEVSEEGKYAGVFIEACVTSLEQSINAAENGANRLELCIDIEVDGLTPPLSMVHQVCKAVEIQVRILVRPRSGNFVYTKSEYEYYLKEISAISLTSVEGIVIGALTESGLPDLHFLAEAKKCANNKKICFHKAIDVSQDILQATQLLVDSGLVDAILSSGGQASAVKGLPMLTKMREICKNNVELVAAGKIVPSNLEQIHDHLLLTAYHGRGIVNLE